MIRPVDSHGRSRLLEFSRSPLLERNAPPPTGKELTLATTRNSIPGFGKFIGRDWTWFPSMRQRLTYDAEFRDNLDTCGTVSLNSTFGNLVTSESPGFTAGLAGFQLIARVETSRTATEVRFQRTLFNAATQAQKIVVEVYTLEGTSKDTRGLADDFWATCASLAAVRVDQPPLQVAAPVLLEILSAVNDDLTMREVSRSLRIGQTQAAIDATIASSLMQVAVPDPNFDLLDFGTGLPRCSINLVWNRHVRHFDPRGESQFGELDKPFLTPLFALSCTRGFTEEYEYVTPPVLSSGRLADFPIATFSGTLPTFIESRIIPPNPTAILLTC